MITEKEEVKFITKVLKIMLNQFMKERNRLTDVLREKEAWRPTHFSYYQVFFLHFPLELSYGYLWFEGNGKIPLGR